MEKVRSEILCGGIDYLNTFPELTDRQALSGDGHYHEHATHAKRSSVGKPVASGAIYLLDMHTGTSSRLAVVQTKGKKNYRRLISR